jgi:hypothetical protein
MARNAGVSTETNFNRGLITEVTGVNSPENSVTETINVIYDRKGRALTRKGFEYEEGVDQQVIGTSGVRGEYLWETISDNSSKDFVVLQIGEFLHFFEVTGDESLSAGYQTFTVDLTDYKVTGFYNSQVRATLATFATGKGYLFVTHPNCETLYIKYNKGSGTITVSEITIQIRDFEGIPEVTNFDTRPVALNTTHKYNLYNQGWYASVQRDDTDNISPVQALDYWETNRSDYPSSADVWWYYTRTGITGSTGGPASSLDKFNPDLADTRKDLYGNVPAPKGHYIVDALQTNRSTLSGIPGVTETDSDGYRPSVVAFFTGRAFYGGVGKSGYSSTIYFSQIIENDNQLGRCYQLNDPTSRESFDLLASDGGTIKIQDINTVLDLRVIGDALYIFATNGVWSVTGTDNGPFRATDYTVSKISSFPAISKTSIVDVGGLPIWWNYEGIFSLKMTEVGLTSEVTNLTQTTIQTFYDDIPQGAKLTAKGAFNDQTGLIYWLYNTSVGGATYDYTNILVLDAVTSAFYPLSIPEHVTRQISGIVAVRSSGELFVEETVTASGGDVVDGLGALVTTLVSAGFSAMSKTFKFPVHDGSNVAFAELTDDSYLDWGTTTYERYFITGYRIRGDLIKKFQTNYLTVITEEIDDGSCFVQGLWDYSNHPNSGRFTNPQQVYRTRTLRNYQRSRLQIRGTGYSLQFKFFGESGKPFVIAGWSGFETSDAMP